MEILHNNVKVATSGTTVSNYGPFDNLYGDPTIPTAPQTLAVDQFIGMQKGTIPTRLSEFITDTGISITMIRAQLTWFKYTPTDYALSPTVTVRITGAGGTSWFMTRRCV